MGLSEVLWMVRIAVPLDNNNGLDSIVSFRLGRAPFFAIVDLEGGEIRNLNIYANPNAGGMRGVGIATAQWLASMGVRIVLASKVGPNAMQALQALGIQIMNVAPGIPLRQALSSYSF